MTDIVAGRFQQQTDAHAAIENLLRHGFRRDDVTSFFVNPPGQHARFPVGGDRNISPAARGAGLAAIGGTILGTAVGFVVGLLASHALGAVAIIVGTAVGAYLGMFAGALTRLQGRPKGRRGDVVTQLRSSGIIVAAHTPTAKSRNEAVRTLLSSGAADLEAAQGDWHDGQWADFDPTMPPKRVSAPTR